MKKYFIEFIFTHITEKKYTKSFTVELHYSNIDDAQIMAICKNRLPSPSCKFVRVTKLNLL